MATTQPGGRYTNASGVVVDANGKPIEAQPEAVTVATPEPATAETESDSAPAPKKRAVKAA